MGSKDASFIAIILSLNVVLFVSTLVSAQLEPPSCPTENLNYFCANANLLNTVSPQTTLCCKLIQRLVEFDGSACICDAIKDNIFGFINDDINVSFDEILSLCETDKPTGFTCNDDTPNTPSPTTPFTPPPNPTTLPPITPPSTPPSISTTPPFTPPSIPTILPPDQPITSPSTPPSPKVSPTTPPTCS